MYLVTAGLLFLRVIQFLFTKLCDSTTKTQSFKLNIFLIYSFVAFLWFIKAISIGYMLI